MKVFNVQGDFIVLKCDPVTWKDRKSGNDVNGFRVVLTQDYENNYVCFTDKAIKTYSQTGSSESLKFSSISVYFKDGVEHCYFNL